MLTPNWLSQRLVWQFFPWLGQSRSLESHQTFLSCCQHLFFNHLISCIFLVFSSGAVQNSEFLHNTIHKRGDFVPQKMIFPDFFIFPPTCDSHSLHREVSHHRCTDYKFHNAIPASPGRCHIFHNASYSCLAQLHPSKMNTNTAHRILYSCNRQVNLLTALVHSRMAAHIFHPTHHLKDLYIPQYFELYKSKVLLHPPR